MSVALFIVGDSPFHWSILLLSVWPVPPAAVISGHDTDFKASSTLLAHSCRDLKGERERRKCAEIMTEFQRDRGKLQLLCQSCVICHSSTVINIFRCHQTGLDRVTLSIQYCQVRFYWIKFPCVVVSCLFIRKQVTGVCCQELRFQRQGWIMEDV